MAASKIRQSIEIEMDTQAVNFRLRLQKMIIMLSITVSKIIPAVIGPSYHLLTAMTFQSVKKTN